jgi:hypothetical protein
MRRSVRVLYGKTERTEGAALLEVARSVLVPIEWVVGEYGVAVLARVVLAMSSMRIVW